MSTAKSAIRITTSIVLYIYCSSALAQTYDKIWKHINTNERNQAQVLLDQIRKSGKLSTDEFITDLLLKSFNGKDNDITDFLPAIHKSENEFAYIYALWFTDPVAGDYGYKNEHQLALLNYLANVESRNGLLRAAAHYSLGHHYVRTNQLSKIKKENEKIKAISNWQLVGPFYNISGSGFNKDFAPVSHSYDTTIFLSSTNAPIKWFTQPVQSNEGWSFIGSGISESSGGLAFAQTFVKSDQARNAWLRIGFLGSVKVWLNDQLLIAEPEERVTEIDAYSAKCKLKAGYNRILLQIGSENSEPNFIIRLTDSLHNPLDNIRTVAAAQPYEKVGGEALENGVPHFAEAYFQEKIKKEPNNILNYILLNRTYLRSRKVFEARKTIEKALQLAPGNTLLKYELYSCFNKEGNTTGRSEIHEYFKEHEKQSLIGYILRVDELSDQKKYQAALDTLEEQVKRYGSHEDTFEKKIQLLSELNNTTAFLTTLEEAGKKFPRNASFAGYMFGVEKKLKKNPKAALKFLENYLQNNYSYELKKILVSEYFSQNNKKKSHAILQEQIQILPHYMDLRMDLLNELIAEQLYSEANKLCDDMLKMMPYSGDYHNNKAFVEASLGRNTEAIKCYRKALIYKPTLYDSYEKIRVLENKKSVFDQVPHEKPEDIVAKTGKNIKEGAYDYYYLSSEKTTVIYPEGGREEESIVIIKILNQRGIDRYKESQISFNKNTESLVIEDAQLIKANGKRAKPEIEDNKIVWTDLEVNDVIYVKYKRKYYFTGRLAREYYDTFGFEGTVPIEFLRYTLIIPEKRKFTYEVLNGQVEPKISSFENYKMYTWSKENSEVLNNEPFMPVTTDIATTLHISTINDWNEISRWYSDVLYSKITNNYEVTEVYHKLFDGKTNLSAEEKARRIYYYIAENISYSSVSFRQSGLIPQKASQTIITRLGDCKDISTLFVSLADMCGLKANLVLVSTRGNGKKGMVLPSFLFNHCIVKFFDEQNKEHFLELTDRDIPFKSLPQNLYEATSLTIPGKDDLKSQHSITPINTTLKTKDKVRTSMKINIRGNDMDIVSGTTKYGNLSTGIRAKYLSLSPEKVKEEMQKSVSKDFSSPVKVSNVVFKTLKPLLDSVSYQVTMNVSNNVKKIGQQSAFIIPFTDAVVSAAPFNIEDRKYDFEYWDYENTDEYETKIEINLPSGKQFTDIPKNEKFTFKNIRYSISYAKPAPNRLLVERHAYINRQNLTPSDYNKAKNVVSKVLDLEGAYITFK